MRQSRNHTRLQGFSLVELSIVLVIIGLLVGGIVTGKSLIRSSELRSLTTEVMRYEMLAKKFRERYYTYPGDLPEATTYWGAAHATPSTCRTTAGTGTETCNGDGDGYIELNNGTANGKIGENFLFWEHLANAEMIGGDYTGTPLHTNILLNYGCEIDVNCPKTSINGVTIVAESSAPNASNANFVEHKQSNHFTIGRPTDASTYTDHPFEPFLTTAESFAIDTKIDDGKVTKGRWMSVFKNGATGNYAANAKDCADNSDVDAAEYDLTITDEACTILYMW